MNFIPMNPKQLIFPFAIDQYPRFDNFYHSHIQQLIYSLSRSLQESTESEFVITGTERSGKSFLLQACNKKDLPDLSVPVITNSDSVDSCSDLERL